MINIEILIIKNRQGVVFFMSELTSAIDFLETSDEIIENEIVEENDETPEKEQDIEDTVFDIQKFGRELYSKSEMKNKERLSRPSQNITGYDIAHNCIMQVLFKLRNTPIKNYADSWLPIFMRTEVGSAVHNFIQGNTSQFTETEVNLKIPSIGFYGKIDYMIGGGVLGEIKTCTYSDYKTIVNQQKPREKDFLQAFTYYYMLKNYLDEARSVEIYHGMGDKPRLDRYDVRKMQFLYIAHDIISSQAESYSEMMEYVKIVKQNLNSRKNSFFFITSLVIDITDEMDKQYSEYIRNKLDDIHHYMKTCMDPTKESRFVNTKNCFFCPYKEICKIK